MFRILRKRNLTYALLVICIGVLNGCKEIPSNWANPNVNASDFKPNILSLESSHFENIPLTLSEAELRQNLGLSERVHENFYQSHFNHESKEKVTVYYDLHTYFGERLTYSVFADTAILNYLDLKDTTLRIVLNGKEFSSETKLKEMKEVFPESYSWRNGFLSQAQHRYYDESMRQRFDFIVLEEPDGLHENWIELFFIDERLACISFRKNYSHVDESAVVKSAIDSSDLSLF